MPEAPVVNASPLIILAHGAAFDLLRVAGDELVVPSSVAVKLPTRPVRSHGPGHRSGKLARYRPGFTHSACNSLLGLGAGRVGCLGMGLRAPWGRSNLRRSGGATLRVRHSAYRCAEPSPWYSVPSNVG